MDLTRLIYASRPFGFDDAILNGILADARRHNAPNDITGALICRADLYLQLLEGPKAAIDDLYGRIARDDRHLVVRRLVYAPTSRRLFAGWAMRDDPARSWMWTPKKVAAGAIAAATPDELSRIFERVATEPR